MTPDDIAALADGLTEAQRKAISNASSRPQLANSQIRSTGPTCMALTRRGLMSNAIDSIGHNTWRLTPLGLLVKAHLLGSRS